MTEFKDTGPAEWPDGRVHHEELIVTLPPNSVVECTYAGVTYDCDFNSWQEGRNGINGQPTYAIITSRSYHSGIVLLALGDGSTRAISNNMDLRIRLSLGTRGFGEVMGEF